MKLSELKEGTTCILKSSKTKQHFEERASSMGLVPGTRVRMLRNQKKMPLLIYARDTLLAVNRADASGIEVEIHE